MSKKPPAVHSAAVPGSGSGSGEPLREPLHIISLLKTYSKIRKLKSMRSS